MIPEVPGILEDMLALHKEKSQGYGSDHDPAHNFTAVASIAGEKKFYYPMLRIGEKLTRALNLYEAERFDDLSEELRDIALIAVLAEALRMQYVNSKIVSELPSKVAFHEQLSRTRPMNEAFVRREVKNPLIASPLPIVPHDLDTAKTEASDIIPNVDFTEKPSVIDFMLERGLVVSRAEAKRLIRNGAIIVNDDVLTEDREVRDTDHTIRKGKRQEVKIGN